MRVTEYIQASIEHPDRCEDALHAFPGTTTGTNPPKTPIFIMIDGMGGHQRITEDGQTLTGRDAAQAIRSVFIEDLEHLGASVSAESGLEAEIAVRAAFQRANQQVYQQINNGSESEIYQRVGAVATVVIVCEEGKRLLAAQVGDTRAYVFTEGELIQLCEDEDNVGFLVKQGRLSQRDAERVTQIVNGWDGLTEPTAEGAITIGTQSYDAYLAWRWFVNGNVALRIPGANIVINSIGTEGEELEIQVSRIEVLPGDVLLMCSDGLYKNLSNDEIIHLLTTAENPAQALGEAAYIRSQDENNMRMNPDDIAIIVAQL